MVGPASRVPDHVDHREQQVGTRTGTAEFPPTCERIRARVERQLAVIELHAHSLLHTNDRDGAEIALAAARALIDWFVPLGLPAAAGIAQQLARELEAPESGPGTAVRLADLTKDVRDLVAIALSESVAVPADAAFIVVVGPPTARVDSLCWVLSRSGAAVLHTELTVPPLDREPAALVLVLDDADAARTLVAGCRQAFGATAIVGLTTDAGPAGAIGVADDLDTLSALDADPALIVREVERAIAVSAAPYRLLIVGGDPGGLPTRGPIHLERIDPVDLADLIRELERPDTGLVLGPGIGVRDVLRVAEVIRATPNVRQAPIVAAATATETQRIRFARLDVEVDVPASLWVPKLLERLRTRVAMSHQTLDLEPSSLLPWNAAQLLIDRTLVTAHRASTTVSLATIVLHPSLDGDVLEGIHDTLRAEFRRNDIVGILDDHHIVVTLLGAPRHVATKRLEQLADRLELGSHASRIGVAQFPQDGRSSGELVAAADAAVHRGAERNGPTVVPTDWREVDAATADVLIVDPDEMLAAVLQSALAEHALTAAAVTNGHQALELLTSGAPLPLLLIVELDTPGIDGLRLLEHLRSSGVLGRLCVMLLTSRTREADIARALELGADDVLRKPFLTTLFTHRAVRMVAR